MALNNLGLIAWYDRDPVASRVLHSESLALYLEIGDRWGTTTSMNDLGNLAWFADGNSAEARALYEKSLAIRRELNDKVGMATSLNDLARVACAESRYSEARTLLEGSLHICWEVGEKRSLIHCLMGFAWMTAAQDCPAIAARLLGAASALTSTTGFKLRPVDIAEYERTAGIASGALDSRQFSEAWKRGHDMSTGQVISLVLDKDGQSAAT